MIGALVARKAIAGAIDALNRHDLKTFMSAWRDDGTFVYPGDIPESGTFQGEQAIERWFRNFFDQYPTIHFDIRDLGVRNLFDVLGNNSSPSTGTSGWSIEQGAKGRTAASRSSPSSEARSSS